MDQNKALDQEDRGTLQPQVYQIPCAESPPFGRAEARGKSALLHARTGCIIDQLALDLRSVHTSL